MDKREKICRIIKQDDDEHLVYAEVYAPNTLDTFGEFMLAEDIKKMAHAFMRLELDRVIDTNHNNEPNGSYPVESYIAGADDPDFTPGAWVLGVKVPDEHTWGLIKHGEINGFSFEAMVKPVEFRVRIKTIRDHVGVTREDDKGSDHTHMFFVQVNEKGIVERGMTSPGPDGHVHRISRASFTDRAGELGHNHRFDMI